jgi:hypothetical protein
MAQICDVALERAASAEQTAVTWIYTVFIPEAHRKI